MSSKSTTRAKVRLEQTYDWSKRTTGANVRLERTYDWSKRTTRVNVRLVLYTKLCSDKRWRRIVGFVTAVTGQLWSRPFFGSRQKQIFFENIRQEISIWYFTLWIIFQIVDLISLLLSASKKLATPKMCGYRYMKQLPHKEAVESKHPERQMRYKAEVGKSNLPRKGFWVENQD